MGVGFDRKNEQIMAKLTSSSDEERIFHFDEEYDKKIEKVNFSGCSSLKDKKIHMIAYLAELAYDLALDPSSNVSKNPGFETPLGVFSRTDG